MILLISRRLSLKVVSSLALLGIAPRREGHAEDVSDRLERWDRTRDRVFLGDAHPDYPVVALQDVEPRGH